MRTPCSQTPEHTWTRVPAPLTGSLNPRGPSPTQGRLVSQAPGMGPAHRNTRSRPFQAEGHPEVHS